MDKSLSYESYIKMWDAILKWKTANGGVLPRYVDWEGLRIMKADYQDAATRVIAYRAKNNGNNPNTVRVSGTPLGQPTPAKSALRRALEDAVGEYKNGTELYNLFKGRGYAYYYNDVYNQAQAIARLKARAGINCSDGAQVMFAGMADMGYGVRYVHIICRSGTGHIQLDVRGKEFGDNWKRIDPAAALKSSYSLGSLWCASGRVISYNDNWLLSDDGR